jgi:SH3 domain-containing YSC84-like protein 1
MLRKTGMKPQIVKLLVQCAGLAALSLSAAACSSSNEPKSPEKVASEQTEAANRLDDAAQLVSQFRTNIPDQIATRGRCAVVLPSLVKGGLVFGGQSGHGFAACQTATGWSAPAPVTVSGGSFGAQIGVQSTALLAILTTDSAKQALESGNFKVGTDASAAAGPVGTGTKSAADVGAKSEVLSYSRSKGLYAGVSLNGSSIKPDDDAIVTMYGGPIPIRSILEGQVAMPNDASARRFTAALTQAFPAGRLAQR